MLIAFRYHTHPFSPPLPSLRDIDSQLEYEMKMKGSNDASYTPCIGIIVCKYTVCHHYLNIYLFIDDVQHLESYVAYSVLI